MRCAHRWNSSVASWSNVRGRGTRTGMISVMLPGPRRHHDHAVGQQHRLGDRVGDEDDGLRPLGPDAQELEGHHFARQGIERAERLVHEQDVRIADERPADCRPLLHAARELARHLPLEARQPDQAEQRPAFSRCPAPPGRS